MSQQLDDTGFRLFAGNLEAAIAAYNKGEPPKEGADLLLEQRRQFEELVALESEFKKALLADKKWGPWTYDAFVKKVRQKNVLTARPFFRERQPACIGPITSALKDGKPMRLARFHFNYNFVQFALRARKWPKSSPLHRLGRRIAAARNTIIEQNMPLAISQARRFWAKAPAKTQDARFTFMDFVQVAADGMTSAVDKFVVPPAAEMDRDPGLISVWRSVAIQRAVGNFIEMFTETPVHFYPQERRKLYRANKNLSKHQGKVDFDLLAAQVNKDLEGSGLSTTAQELSALMGAASAWGSEPRPQQGGDDEGRPEPSPLDRARADPETQPDNEYAKIEAIRVMRGLVAGGLTVLERKLLVQKLGADLV